MGAYIGHRWRIQPRRKLQKLIKLQIRTLRENARFDSRHAVCVKTAIIAFGCIDTRWMERPFYNALSICGRLEAYIKTLFCSNRVTIDGFICPADSFRVQLRGPK